MNRIRSAIHIDQSGIRNFPVPSMTHDSFGILAFRPISAMTPFLTTTIWFVKSAYEFETEDGKVKGRGVNSLELFFDGTRWWIFAASWDQERPGNRIPKEYLRRVKSGK